MSDLLENKYSHDKITRALSKEIITSKNLWKVVKPQIKKINDKEGILILDDTHFFVHLNKALDASRRALRKDFPDEVLFKNLRWALLKKPNDLSGEEKDVLSNRASASNLAHFL